jgi:hypothetical protein
MGRRDTSGARERQGGNGRSDAARLPAGNILRGVRTALRGLRRPSGLAPEATVAKRSEPHDRQRDATSLQATKRRKPARWCKTTRSEQSDGPGSPFDEAHGVIRAREWTLRGDVDGGVNGASSGQLARLRGRIPRESAERASARATGFRFEEEPRPGGSHLVVARRHGREASEPRRRARQRATPRWRRERPTTRNARLTRHHRTSRKIRTAPRSSRVR